MLMNLGERHKRHASTYEAYRYSLLLLQQLAPRTLRRRKQNDLRIGSLALLRVQDSHSLPMILHLSLDSRTSQLINRGALQ